MREAVIKAVAGGANLRGANLYGANLRGADLSGANLRGADLGGADLGGADLRGANLRGADLGGADLRGANLRGANLSGADLYGADLGDANLYGANLYGANLSGANLYGANLRGADLSGANLRGADLGGAKNAELAIAKTRILPAGDLIVYKKAYLKPNRIDPVIVTLLIPAKAKRTHAFGRKCRASFAIVKTIEGKAKEAVAGYDSKFVYRVGKRVKPREPFDENWQEECASGIHFFLTREEAANYES